MSNNKKNSLLPCSECGTRISIHAEICPDCGYPVSELAQKIADAVEAGAVLKEYKLIQLLGGSVMLSGVVAAMADSPFAATLAIMIGAATYLTGLLGAWWNSGH